MTALIDDHEPFSSISLEIWGEKYRARAPDGTPLENSVEETWRRVANALAAPEAGPAEWAERFHDALAGFRFVPAGRILAGAGLGGERTLFNCFVMGTLPADMAGLFEALRESALTLQQGGGIGCDFSTLMPRASADPQPGGEASDPLAAMDLWDAMCRTVIGSGHRRGAMMATLRCDHPDIEAFIEAKRDPARLRMFNLSVLVTDRLMQAVEHDLAFPLRFGGQTVRTVRARDSWDRIMRAAYDCAEPGVIFIDRVNRTNNLYYCETIHATNPCGEQPLPPYGACLLGAVNLAALVRRPFSTRAAIDPAELDHLTRIAVRMLDNAIDVSRFPLPAQRREALGKRRIGLGITGLADALIMCGIRYGSREAINVAGSWLKILRRAAYLASTELAVEKGPFPLFDREAYLAGRVVSRLDAEIRTAIRKRGIRNALLTSIAPTGTTSLLAGNISSGIEPVFSFVHRRRRRPPAGGEMVEELDDFAYRLFRQHYPGSELPDYFVDTRSLRPDDHLAVQSAMQAFVDGAISKTVNVPRGLGYTSFQNIYRDAYRLGCKGCAAYRPNAVTGAVLEAEPPPSRAEERDLCGSTECL